MTYEQAKRWFQNMLPLLRTTLKGILNQWQLKDGRAHLLVTETPKDSISIHLIQPITCDLDRSCWLDQYLVNPATS